MVTNGILPTEFFMRRCDVPLPIHRAKWWEAPRTPGMILYRVVDSCLRHELSVLDLHFRTSACMLPCTCMQLRSWFMSSICRYFLGKLANLYSLLFLCLKFMSSDIYSKLRQLFVHVINILRWFVQEGIKPSAKRFSSIGIQVGLNILATMVGCCVLHACLYLLI
jgi:hypothetical protein